MSRCKRNMLQMKSMMWWKRLTYCERNSVMWHIADQEKVTCNRSCVGILILCTLWQLKPMQRVVLVEKRYQASSAVSLVSIPAVQLPVVSSNQWICTVLCHCVKTTDTSNYRHMAIHLMVSKRMINHRLIWHYQSQRNILICLMRGLAC